MRSASTRPGSGSDASRRRRRTLPFAGAVSICGNGSCTMGRPCGQHWRSAASARDPACLARLLDLAAAAQDPRLGSTIPAADLPSWAIVHDRQRVLALCPARGIPFDPAKAFAEAAERRSVGVMRWLYERARPRPEGGAPTVVLDLHAAALAAVKEHLYYRRTRRESDGIAWLCEVAAYAPRSSSHLRALVERACSERTACCTPHRRALAAGLSRAGRRRIARGPGLLRFPVSRPPPRREAAGPARAFGLWGRCPRSDGYGHTSACRT